MTLEKAGPWEEGAGTEQGSVFSIFHLFAYMSHKASILVNFIKWSPVWLYETGFCGRWLMLILVCLQFEKQVLCREPRLWPFRLYQVLCPCQCGYSQRHSGPGHRRHCSPEKVLSCWPFTDATSAQRHPEVIQLVNSISPFTRNTVMGGVTSRKQ